MQTALKVHTVNHHLLQNENEIIEAFKANPERFEVLYDKYYEQIFRYAYQRLNDKETAADITSQVFLKAMMNLKKYKCKGLPFSSWLYRIARNELTDLFRKKKSRRTINIDTAHLNNIIDEIEENNLEEHHEIITEAISHLAEKDLAMVEMRYFEQRPFREIAEILGITENNAKVKMYRVLDKLKKLIIKNYSHDSI